jgi:hypothetical protein|nr:MAG TPA: hypothetical protein [Caudoviricetes sp.]
MSYIAKEIGEKLIERIYKQVNNSKKSIDNTIKEWKEKDWNVNGLRGYKRGYKEALKMIVEEIRELEGE